MATAETGFKMLLAISQALSLQPVYSMYVHYNDGSEQFLTILLKKFREYVVQACDGESVQLFIFANGIEFMKIQTREI